MARGEQEGGPATELLEQASASREDLPWFSYFLGNLHYTSNPSRAIEQYKRAAEIFSQRDDAHGEIVARLNCTNLLIDASRMDEARREIDRVRSLANESKEPGDRAWGEIALARLLLERGENLALARALLQDLEIPEGAADAGSLTRQRLFFLGRVEMASGDFRAARGHFRQLLEVAIAHEQHHLETTTRSNLAWAAWEIFREEPSDAHRGEARALAEEALDVASRNGVWFSEALAAWFLGSLTPGDQGREYLDRCYAVAASPEVRSHCLNALAVTALATDPQRARELIEESRRQAVLSQSEWAEIRMLQHSMPIDWSTLPAAEALRSSWVTLSSIEALRDRQSTGSEAQAGVFSVWSDEYGWLAGRLLEDAVSGRGVAGGVDESFRVMERKRARALMDWLRAAEQTPAPDSAEFAATDDVRAALEPDQALLSFQVAPWRDASGQFAGGSWVIVVTRDAMAVHRLPGRVRLRWAVRRFEGRIGRRDGAEMEQTDRLYKDLLADALADLPEGIERLILVPDDALHRLPFAALRASEDGEPLGARYELVQVPSATLWLRWREAEPEPAEQPLLVLADPQLPRDEASTEIPLQVAQTREAAETYDPLPWARDEGNAAVDALGGGTLLIGAAASEAALRALAPGKCGIVHLGTHAVTNEDRPERSAVLLAPSPGAGRPAGRREGTGETEDDPGDGYLRSAEIARLDLSGMTVVLASCRSAGGSTLRGEGVMSLARAFFQAGAHGVVASLWPLRDDESAAMFERFYDHLGRGESVAAALRSARREAIEAGEPAAAWAGLVVLGDGSAVPLPGGRRLLDHPALPLVVSTVLALAVVLVVLFAVRRRRSAAPTA